MIGDWFNTVMLLDVVSWLTANTGPRIALRDGRIDRILIGRGRHTFCALHVRTGDKMLSIQYKTSGASLDETIQLVRAALPRL
jgi:hypothetical protein